MNRLEPDRLESSLLADCAGLAGVDGKGLGKFERGDRPFPQCLCIHRMPGESDSRFPLGQIHQKFLKFERA
jgi:hypothetical protein